MLDWLEDNEETFLGKFIIFLISPALILLFFIGAAYDGIKAWAKRTVWCSVCEQLNWRCACFHIPQTRIQRHERRR